MDTLVTWTKRSLRTVTEVYQRTTNPQKPLPDLHALVIGIDDYQTITPLSGAVSDANSIDQFLQTDLAVPPGQITNLRNDQATRSAIIDGFHALRDNPRIKPLDPILVYYAGHGSEVDTPSGWEGTDSKAQCLVPWDVGLPDASGNAICPIPDYTIAALLYDIAEEKGNNITVIFDCCHSASSTRGVLKTKKLPFSGTLTFPSIRKLSLPGMALPPRPPVDLTPSGSALVRYAAPSTLPPLDPGFEEASLSRAASKPKRSARRGMRSHVLLAACGHAELAYECTHIRNGYFTDNLLQVLRSSQIHKLTYKSCMANFPRLSTPRPQNPVCEGEHVNRFFFNATVPGAHRSFIPIMETAEGYILSAGLAQGIAPGSKFSIHAEDVLGPDNPSLGTFVAVSFVDNPSRSFCQLDQELTSLPDLLFARLADLQVDMLFNVMFTDAFNQSVQTASSLLSDQTLVTSRDSAHLVLDINEQTGHITFELLDPLWNALGLSILPRTSLPNSDIIKHILDSLTMWRWHHLRVPNERPFARAVQIAFYRLQNLRGHLEPVGDDLNEDGATNVQVSPNDMFGFKITNNSSRPLYVYLFFFSTVNQSIRPLFLKVFGSASVDPLEVGASLTLGYHNDDLHPLSFDLGQTPLDVGTFRLFVTTSPADFESVAQPSPFTALECIRPDGDEFVDGVCFESGNWQGPDASDSVPVDDKAPPIELEHASEPTGLVPESQFEPVSQVEPQMVEIIRVETTLGPDSEQIIYVSESMLIEVPEAQLPEVAQIQLEVDSTSTIYQSDSVIQVDAELQPADAETQGEVATPEILYELVDDFEISLLLNPQEMWDVIDMQIVLRNSGL